MPGVSGDQFYLRLLRYQGILHCFQLLRIDAFATKDGDLSALDRSAWFVLAERRRRKRFRRRRSGPEGVGADGVGFSGVPTGATLIPVWTETASASASAMLTRSSFITW